MTDNFLAPKAMTKICTSFESADKGAFKNYVDHFLPYFDQLPTSG